MVNADVLKKAAVIGAAISCVGAAFFHHRIQGIRIINVLEHCEFSYFFFSLTFVDQNATSYCS